MDDPTITFDRDRGTEVCATVHLSADTHIELWSSEAVGYREWEIEDVELAGFRLSITHADRFLPEGNKLRHAIDRAFHEWIAEQGDT